MNRIELHQLREGMPVRPLTRDEAMRVAELQATKLLLLTGTTQAPVWSETLQQIKGITMQRRTGLPVSGAAQHAHGEWIVALNASESRFRQRFSWAHEIKHIIDHPVIDFLYPGADGKPSDQRAEQVANYFAACLLMPRVFIQRWWDEGIHHPVDLAWRCAVNPSAMRIRLRQLGFDTADSVRRVGEA